jgi:hypothetical protein
VNRLFTRSIVRSIEKGKAMDAPSVTRGQFTRDAGFWSDSETANVRFAAIGEEVRVWLTGRRWRRNNDGGTMVRSTVQPPCNNPTSGHWLCLTHQEHLIVASELAKHLSEGDHDLVWFLLPARAGNGYSEVKTVSTSRR